MGEGWGVIFLFQSLFMTILKFFFVSICFLDIIGKRLSFNQFPLSLGRLLRGNWQGLLGACNGMLGGDRGIKDRQGMAKGGGGWFKRVKGDQTQIFNS